MFHIFKYFENEKRNEITFQPIGLIRFVEE